MRATRACTLVSRRPSYSLTELMAFADLELPYIPFHFLRTATEDRGPFLQSRAEAAGSLLAARILSIPFQSSWVSAGFAQRQRACSQTLRFDGSRCGDAELSVVAVQQPQLRNQRGFDLPAMKHTHHTPLGNNDGDRAEALGN